jgi:hypothetical protein
LLGQTLRPGDAITGEHWQTRILAAQAEGSLVAVMARRPKASASTCESLRSMDEEVRRFVDGIDPVAMPGAGDDVAPGLGRGGGFLGPR